MQDKQKSYCCDDYIANITIVKNDYTTVTPMCVCCCKFPSASVESIEKALSRLRKYDFVN